MRKRERDNSDSDGDAKETEEKNEPQQLGTATTVQEKVRLIIFMMLTI